MTENMKIAIEAINKWIYFGWNYETVRHEWKSEFDNIWNDYVPRFLVEVKWNCNFHHIYCKWKDAQESKNTDAYLVKFYSSLSSDNRIALIDWVMHNYNDEVKIIHD